MRSLSAFGTFFLGMISACNGIASSNNDPLTTAHPAMLGFKRNKVSSTCGSGTVIDWDDQKQLLTILSAAHVKCLNEKNQLIIPHLNGVQATVLASVVKEDWEDKEADSYKTDIRISKVRLHALNDAIRARIVALPEEQLFSDALTLSEGQKCQVHGSGTFWKYGEDVQEAIKISGRGQATYEIITQGNTTLTAENINPTEFIVNGDSGGPLLCNKNGTEYLVGVTCQGSNGIAQNGLYSNFKFTKLEGSEDLNKLMSDLDKELLWVLMSEETFLVLALGSGLCIMSIICFCCQKPTVTGAYVDGMRYSHVSNHDILNDQVVGIV